MFFKCKCCAEKELRIHDLRDEIKSLRTLVFPQSRASHIPVLSLEVDKVLEGSHEISSLTKDQEQELTEYDKELEVANSEADRLFAGTYDDNN